MEITCINEDYFWSSHLEYENIFNKWLSQVFQFIVIYWFSCYRGATFSNPGPLPWQMLDLRKRGLWASEYATFIADPRMRCYSLLTGNSHLVTGSFGHLEALRLIALSFSSRTQGLKNRTAPSQTPTGPLEESRRFPKNPEASCRQDPQRSFSWKTFKGRGNHCWCFTSTYTIETQELIY